MMLVETSAPGTPKSVPLPLGSDANGNITDYLQFQVSNFAYQVSTVAHFEYSPFGQVTFQSGDLADSFAFRYSSKYYMPELNMNDFGMRWYSPEVGRFINRDPIEESGGTLLYGYCGNEPVGRWDLLGMAHADFEITTGVWYVELTGSAAPSDEWGQPPLAAEGFSGISANSAWSQVIVKGPGNHCNSVRVDYSEPGSFQSGTIKASVVFEDNDCPGIYEVNISYSMSAASTGVDAKGLYSTPSVEFEGKPGVMLNGSIGSPGYKSDVILITLQYDGNNKKAWIATYNSSVSIPGAVMDKTAMGLAAGRLTVNSITWSSELP